MTHLAIEFKIKPIRISVINIEAILWIHSYSMDLPIPINVDLLSLLSKLRISSRTTKGNSSKGKGKELVEKNFAIELENLASPFFIEVVPVYNLSPIRSNNSNPFYYIFQRSE